MRISIVTPSFNQGRYLGRTIESVLAQGYPDLEHIVVDGMSHDETPQVLARSPHLRVIREPDRGQADAINKGFRLATGDVLAFLNSDDLLAPGALHRVVREIDPERGRHVVMGRCRFIDEDDRPTGLEHPSQFVSHRRVWQGYTLPQPAIFWTRQVWQRCGPLDPDERLVLDYDLFCRFSRHYRFHAIDQVLACYRLHAASKTCRSSSQDVLKESLRVSRKYWGPWYRPQFWQVLASYLKFRLARRRRAMGLLREARDAWAAGRWLGPLVKTAACLAFAPDVAAHVVLLPQLARRRPGWFGKLRGLARLVGPAGGHSESLTWRSFDRMHADGWAGPILQTALDVRPGQKRLHLEGTVEIGHHLEPLELALSLDGRPLGRFVAGRAGGFVVAASLDGVPPGRHELRVEANRFLVLHDFRGNGDFRPVSYKLRRLSVSA
jgi:glycosyltransferase involved in cell wall biosynthesis